MRYKQIFAVQLLPIELARLLHSLLVGKLHVRKALGWWGSTGGGGDGKERPAARRELLCGGGPQAGDVCHNMQQHARAAHPKSQPLRRGHASIEPPTRDRPSASRPSLSALMAPQGANRASSSASPT